MLSHDHQNLSEPLPGGFPIGLILVELEEGAGYFRTMPLLQASLTDIRPAGDRQFQDLNGDGKIELTDRQ